MNLVGPFAARLIFHVFVVVVGTLILAGAVNTAIVGSNGVLNRVSEDGVLTRLVPAAAPADSARRYRIINMVVVSADPDDFHQPRRRDVSREPVRLRRDLEFRDERDGGAGAALHASRASANFACR